MKNIINALAIASVAMIFTGFPAAAQTNGQNFYTPNGNPPATPRLTNPSGSAVYTPNSPPHTLGGAAMQPNTSSNINIMNAPIPDNTTNSLPNINTIGTGTGGAVTPGTGGAVTPGTGGAATGGTDIGVIGSGKGAR